MPAEILQKLAPIFEDSERAAGYLAHYYTSHEARHTPRGGRFFEKIGEGSQADRFTPQDLLAISALSVDVPAHSIETILKSQTLKDYLAEIPTDRDIWHDDVEQFLVEGGAADEAWHFLKDIYDIGNVIAGKLLALKRPRLIPIYDKIVRQELKPPSSYFWLSMRMTLAEGDGPAFRELVETVRAAAIVERAEDHDFVAVRSIASISTLRVIDVVVWEFGMRKRHEAISV